MSDEQQSLLRRIEEAFPRHVWPKDELAACDDSGDLDCQYITEHFQGKHWGDISAEELGYTSQDAWAFDEEALARFLPAWLVADVRSGSCHFDKMAHHCFNPTAKHLTREQAAVVYDCLLYAYPGVLEQEEDDWPWPAASLNDYMKWLGKALGSK